jgi:geranylgeranyl diphosphate synthase type II
VETSGPVTSSSPGRAAHAGGLAPRGDQPTFAEADLYAYLDECRGLALREIESILPKDSPCGPILYELMLDYPMRSAKALRPALCLATCRALGGRLEAGLRSAAVLEFYHNAFLIHDDVEDGSHRRRDLPTLHQAHGTPIAINVGDAMLALALQPLLDNMSSLGLGKALRILETIARMARETAEGQAIELDWVRRARWDLSDADYVPMVQKKTSWYTFVAPMVIGGIIAGVPGDRLIELRRFATALGTGFQIQDDILNLIGAESLYGKEIGGDLWEGKHTLILLHAMRHATVADRERALAILGKARPPMHRPGSRRDDGDAVAAIRRLVDDLHARGQVTRDGRRALVAAVRRLGVADGARMKTEADVRFLRTLIDRQGSIAYAGRIARRWAERARQRLARVSDWMPPSVHRDFIQGLIDFVVTRDR